MQVVINFVITVKPSNTFRYLLIQNLQSLLQIADKKQTVEWFIMRSFWKNLPEVVSTSQHFSLADRKIKFQLGLQIKLPVNYNPETTGRQK